MLHSVVNVKPIQDKMLELTFSNNERKLFDVKPYMKTGLFSTLEDESVFKTVHVSFDTIEWANGVDIDPEELYLKSKPL